MWSQSVIGTQMKTSLPLSPALAVEWAEHQAYAVRITSKPGSLSLWVATGESHHRTASLGEPLDPDEPLILLRWFRAQPPETETKHLRQQP
jgi:hypothetical protein